MTAPRTATTASGAAEPVRATAPDAESAASLAIFSVLWGLAAMFHLGKWAAWATTPANLALAVAAAFAILRPRDRGSLLALFAAQVWILVTEMPRTSNHVLLMGLVGLVGLAAFAGRSVGGEPPDAARLYRDVAPPARAVLLVVLFAAGFHKLNADWFDRSVSCGSWFWDRIAGRVPGAPDAGWGRAATIAAAPALELAAPLLLLSSRTRLLGLGLAWALLFFLGVGGFANFAAIAGALLFLFAPANPDELATAARRRWPTVDRLVALGGSAAIRRALRLAPPITAGTALVVALSRPWEGRMSEPLLLRSAGVPPPSSYAFELAWPVVAVLGAIALGLGVRAARPRWPSARRLFAHPMPALAVVPALALAAAAGPYLGLGTDTAFSMFSNLRTEAGSNHLVVRRPLDLFGLQGDLVWIEDSSDPELRRVGWPGYLLPWLQFREYVRARTRATGPGFSVTYVRGGDRRVVERAGLDPALVRAPPFLARTLLVFRPVWIGGGNPCRH